MAQSLALRSRHSSGTGMMRLSGIALTVLVLLAALLLLLPQTMDWSRYRGAIAGFASRELGRPVHIDGRISLVLLPQPEVTASGVRIGNPGDRMTMAAPALRLRLALPPLLALHVVPRELVLSGAAIWLPWPMPPATLAGDRPDWLKASSARIEHGTLTIGSVRLTDLNADLAAAPPDVAGAEASGLVVSGSARSFGQLWRFTERLGTPDSDGGAPFEAALDAQMQPASAQPGPPHPDSGAGLHFVGTLARDGGLSGRLSGHAADLSRLIPAPPVAAHGDGSIALGHGAAQAELALDIGGVPVAARLRPAADTTGTQVLSLTTGRLDLDAWAASLARLHQNRRNATPLLSLPWPVSLEVSANAMQLRGGLIRGVHAALDVDGTKGSLRSATATLPGEAQLSLAGTMVEDPSGLSLTGTAALDAPRLRVTLDWLRSCGLRLGDGLPPNVLREAHLTAHVTVDPDRIEASALSGTIEDSRLTAGTAGVATATGAIDADLTLDRLPADNWLPASPPAWQDIAHRLSGTDLALKLHAGTVQLRGHALTHATLDTATDAGGLALNSLAFDTDGLHAALSGSIAGDGTLTDGRLDLAGPQATGLRQYLPGWAHQADYLWTSPIALHAEAAGPRTALVTAFALDLADARLEAHPKLDLSTGAWSAQLTLRHPGAPRLLGALGLLRARDWVGEGSLSVLAQLSGAPGKTRLDSFDITAGTLHAGGDLALDRTTPAPMLTGHIAADTLPLPYPAPHSTIPLALDLLHGWNARLGLTAGQVVIADTILLSAASADLTVQSGALTVSGLKAGLAGGLFTGGVLTGQISLDSAANPPLLSLQTKFVGATLADTLFGTSLDLASGTYTGSIALTGSGYSPAAVTASLAGALTLDATAGSLAGIDLAAARRAVLPGPALTAALSTGTTNFDHFGLALAMANGIAKIDRLTLQGPDGAATATGAFDLTNATMTLLAQLPDQLALRLSGPSAAPQRLAEPPVLAATP